MDISRGGINIHPVREVLLTTIIFILSKKPKVYRALVLEMELNNLNITS